MADGRERGRRPALVAALLTGGFCAVFAAVMHRIAPQFMLGAVIAASALSGFLGSLFASTVLRGRDR